MRALRSLVFAAALGFVVPAAAARAQDQKPDDQKPQDDRKDARPEGPKGAEGKPEGERGKRKRPSLAERLKEPLGLSDDQVKKIQKIEADLHAELAKARAEHEKDQGADKGEPSKEDRDAVRSRMKAMRTKVHAQIRAVLTEDQQKKFDEYLKKQAEQHKKHKDERKDGSTGPL